MAIAHQRIDARLKKMERERMMPKKPLGKPGRPYKSSSASSG
jgi:hypothetical protein